MDNGSSETVTCNRCKDEVHEYIFAFDNKKHSFDTLCYECWMDSKQHEHRNQNGLQKLLDIAKHLKRKKITLTFVDGKPYEATEPTED